MYCFILEDELRHAARRMKAHMAIPLVSAVEPDSPADQAGIQRGLVIYRVGKYDVNSVKQVEGLLSRAQSGTSVDFALGVMRSGGGGQRVETVTIAAR